mmetsp:Transcript_14536/g.45458  ORF Transcript_14536/g.45458 Transcript_14536/m.45458 type:complete len:235 (-) Transcript_14536:2427-3131(-)
MQARLQRASMAARRDHSHARGPQLRTSPQPRDAGSDSGARPSSLRRRRASDGDRAGHLRGQEHLVLERRAVGRALGVALAVDLHERHLVGEGLDGVEARPAGPQLLVALARGRQQVELVRAVLREDPDGRRLPDRRAARGRVGEHVVACRDDALGGRQLVRPERRVGAEGHLRVLQKVDRSMPAGRNPDDGRQELDELGAALEVARAEVPEREAICLQLGKPRLQLIVIEHVAL